MSLHFSHQELQHVQSVILIHFALGSNKSAARLEIHLIPRPGTGRIKDAFHAANTCWGWTVRRSDPKTSGEIPLPTGNGIQYDSLYCSFWHIYLYIRYRYRVYIYITYIPNQENLANQHPINKMTPWHRHFQMPPLLAIDQVQMSLQWLSLVSLAYRLLPAHPNQLLSLPAMPPQRLFFSGCVQQQNTQIFCRISDASLISWRQLLQLSSKAQSLDTKLNDFQWFSIWLHLQPPSPKSGTCTCS